MTTCIKRQPDHRPRIGVRRVAQSVAVLLSTASGAEPAPPDAGTP